jgi:hypothetical protein
MKLSFVAYLSVPLAALFVLPAAPAAAYIGPGAGLGAIAVTLALGVGALLLVVGLVWYPLKRFFKGRKSASGQDGTPNSSESDSKT